MNITIYYKTGKIDRFVDVLAISYGYVKEEPRYLITCRNKNNSKPGQEPQHKINASEVEHYTIAD